MTSVEPSEFQLTARWTESRLLSLRQYTLYSHVTTP